MSAESDGQLEILIKVLSDTLGAEKAAQVMEDYKKRVEEGGHEVEQFNLHSKEGHRLIHMLNEILPGTGLLLKSTFNKENIGLGATIIGLQLLMKVIESVTEKIKEYFKHLEELKKQQAEIDVAKWEAIGKAEEDATKGAIELSKALSGTEDAAKKVLEVDKERLETLKKILEIQGGPKATAEARTRAEMEDQLSEATQNRLDAGIKLQQVSGIDRTGIMEKKGEAEKWLEQHKDDVTKAQEELNKAKATKAFAATQFPMSDKQQNFYDEEIKKAATALEAAKNAEVSHQSLVAAVNRQIAGYDDEIKKAKDELNSWIATIDKLQGDLDKFDQGIKDTGLTDRAAQLKGMGLKPEGKAGQSVLSAVQAEEFSAQGGQLDASGKLSIQHVMDALHAAGLSDRKVIQAAKMMRDMHLDTATKVTEILNDLKLIKAQQAKTQRTPT